MSKEHGLSRRGFLKGAGVVAAGAAGASLVGCAPKAADGGAASTAASATVDEHIAPGVRATANLENAESIAPESAPSQWDKEADIVVVGAGGGGLAAALLARDKGCSVILVEKDATPGGATQHANFYANIAGTSAKQEEMHFALPMFPYERNTFLRWHEMCNGFSVENDVVGNVVEAGGECVDWMIGKGAALACIGVGYMPMSYVTNPKKHKSLTFREITDQFHQLGVQAGAEYFFSTPCSALVTDESGAVIGIKATAADGDMYVKANKGVILCSGGFGMNPDMMKKYIPSGYEACIMGGSMPSHTGEVTRMAMGCGADIAGFDSWNGWESEMDNDTGEWTYFWGARMITQLPWLNIDSAGKRCNFYEWDEFSSKDPRYTQASLPMFQAGQDRSRMQVQASRPGRRAYCIFDSKFEDYMFEIANEPRGERCPLTPDLEYNDTALFDPDWHVDFEAALADGRMKKADTLEELAEMLGLDPEVLKESVDQWNANCEAGEDSGTIYPLNPDFLNPIVEGPFYGAKIGARLSMTLAGLRVDEKLRVCDETGKAIKGLYANFTTAGGLAGEGAFGTGLINGTPVGACGLSWATGYLACKNACEE